MAYLTKHFISCSHLLLHFIQPSLIMMQQLWLPVIILKLFFNDKAFVNLRGKKLGLMWKMLIERSKGNLKIRFSHVQTSAEKGSADWVAEYEFPATGRKVINQIHGEFEFKDGLLYRHTDTFNLHHWAAQTMGLKGRLLGGFGFFRRKVQQNARLALDKYIQKHG